MNNATNNYGIRGGVDFDAVLPTDEIIALARAFDAALKELARTTRLWQNERHFSGRVRHLMLCARKYRTRKKNENRILRYKDKRGLQCRS